MKNPETVMAVRGIRRGFKWNNEGSDKLPPPHLKSKFTIRQDARILQHLKRECRRNGTGAITLERVFQGLLSVHDKHLQSLSEALKMEAV
jgi:hypothetical protein